MNLQIASRFVERNANKRRGVLYEDNYLNKSMLGKAKLTDFAKEFGTAFFQS